MDRTEAAPVARPQSRLSPVLFWILLAAVVFRVVSAVMDRAGADAVGLVRWQPKEKAAALARASGKPILYDFTAAWCGPCKLLDRDWADADIAAKVNDGFVPARVVDRAREEGQNPPEIAELLRRFEIVGFPTVVAASADGSLIGKIDGYRGKDALLRFLREPGRKEEEPGN